jgi:hypothetical protein
MKVKLVAMFKRRADLTPEQFREYYETRHAVLSAKLYPFLKDYRRNYLRHDLGAVGATGMPTPPGADFDVITEITFKTDADYHRLVEVLSDPATSEMVIKDEEQFMDRSASLVYVVEEAVTQFPAAVAP